MRANECWKKKKQWDGNECYLPSVEALIPGAATMKARESLLVFANRSLPAVYADADEPGDDDVVDSPTFGHNLTPDGELNCLTCVAKSDYCTNCPAVWQDD